MRVTCFSFLILASISSMGQDGNLKKLGSWLTDHKFSIRKTFDGSSKDEGKPASIMLKEDYKSTNDYLSIDLGAKISEWELLKNESGSLILYPKIEWHKSNDSTDKKDKLDAGINFEYYPFRLQAPNLPNGLPNKGLKLSPWFQGTSSYKRNFIDDVNELKASFQISLSSNYKFLPGTSMRDKNSNLRFRYYPYVGVEYNKIPDLIEKGKTEEFSTSVARVFIEIWIFPQRLQLNLDGLYRVNLKENSILRKEMPMVSPSLNFYPGKQEAFSLGIEYKQGYDSESKFKFVQIASFKLNAKL